MKEIDLFRIAEKNNIIIDTFPLGESESCSVEMDGGQYIAIDPHFELLSDRKVHLAHELGHCMRNAFYTEHTARDLRGKYERQADEWAIRKLVPFRALKKAIRHGSTEPWQIADVFNVTPEFAYKAMLFWRTKECCL